MEEMPQYVQDVLDLIEYANGDAKKTVWGKKRAQAGHPKPFNLKYIGIGNEDLITDIFHHDFQCGEGEISRSDRYRNGRPVL